LFNSVKDFHQSGFTGAIFANESENLSFSDGKGNVIAREDSWKALGDMFHPQAVYGSGRVFHTGFSVDSLGFQLESSCVGYDHRHAGTM